MTRETQAFLELNGDTQLLCCRVPTIDMKKNVLEVAWVFLLLLLIVLDKVALQCYVSSHCTEK